MQITVKLFATLRHYGPGDEAGKPFIVTLPEGATLAGLIERLALPKDEVHLTFVNGRSQEEDFILKDGDQVGAFPPIGGG